MLSSSIKNFTYIIYYAIIILVKLIFIEMLLGSRITDSTEIDINALTFELIKNFVKSWASDDTYSQQHHAINYLMHYPQLAATLAEYFPLANSIDYLHQVRIPDPPDDYRINEALIQGLWNEETHIRVFHFTDSRLTSTVLVNKKILTLRALGFKGIIDVLIQDTTALGKDEKNNQEKIKKIFPKKPDDRVYFILLDKKDPFNVLVRNTDKDSLFYNPYDLEFSNIPKAAFTFTVLPVLDITHYGEDKCLWAAPILVPVPVGSGIVIGLSLVDVNVAMLHTRIMVGPSKGAITLPTKLVPVIAASRGVGEILADEKSPISDLFLRGHDEKDRLAEYDSIVIRGLFLFDCPENKNKVMRLLKSLLARVVATKRKILILYCDTMSPECFDPSFTGFAGTKFIASPDFSSAISFDESSIVIAQIDTLPSSVFQGLVRGTTLPYLAEGLSLIEFLVQGKVVMQARRHLICEQSWLWYYRMYQDASSKHRELEPMIDDLIKAIHALIEPTESCDSDTVLSNFFCTYDPEKWDIVGRCLQEEIAKTPDELSFALNYLAENKGVVAEPTGIVVKPCLSETDRLKTIRALLSSPVEEALTLEQLAVILGCLRTMPFVSNSKLKYFPLTDYLLALFILFIKTKDEELNESIVRVFLDNRIAALGTLSRINPGENVLLKQGKDYLGTLLEEKDDVVPPPPVPPLMSVALTVASFKLSLAVVNPAHRKDRKIFNGEARFSLPGYLSVKDCGSGGDCLFHSVASQTTDTGETAEELRRLVKVAFQSTNNGMLREMIELDGADVSLVRVDGEEERIVTVDRYIELMGIPGTWGGQIELAVLAHVLNRPIALIIPGYRPMVYPSGVDETGRPLYQGIPIFIYYNGSDHYQRLVIRTGSGMDEFSAFQDILRQTLSDSSFRSVFFDRRLREEYVIEHRHEDPVLQREYDQRFGLVLSK